QNITWQTPHGLECASQTAEPQSIHVWCAFFGQPQPTASSTFLTSMTSQARMMSEQYIQKPTPIRSHARGPAGINPRHDPLRRGDGVRDDGLECWRPAWFRLCQLASGQDRRGDQ